MKKTAKKKPSRVKKPKKAQKKKVKKVVKVKKPKKRAIKKKTSVFPLDKVESLTKKGRERSFVTVSEILYFFPNIEKDIRGFELLIEEWEKQGIEIKDPICTLKVARHSLLYGDRDLESYKLQFLRYYLKLYQTEDVEHTTAHDALSDVYFLRDLAHYLQKNTKLTTEQMILISKQPMMMREMTFGKYSGLSFEEIKKIDREYLQWAIQAMEDKPELIWNMQRVLDSSN